MSEQPDKDQKTHEPTQKKLDDARKKGEVATSPEMRHAMMFLAMFTVFATIGVQTLSGMGRLFVGLWGGAHDLRVEPQGAQRFATALFAELGQVLAPMLGILFGFAVLIFFVQGRPTVAWARMKPKWSKVSPFSGLGRIFGPKGLVEFAKTLAKFAFVITVVLIVLWPKAVALDDMVGISPEGLLATIGSLIMTMLKAVLILVAALALFDFLYQRRSFAARMRMTLQELKDEHKQAEGDPQIKARIRSIGIQRSRRRMMAAVPEASVVITNPTHYAVALKYDHGKMAAPVVVAKGVDAVALRIRAIATGAGVPVMESPPLARALHAAVEVDHPIPVEHYAAVAEIIGYVMRLARSRA